MLSIDIYSKPNCLYCTRAKMLFGIRGYSFNEYVVGSDLTKEQFLELFPNAKTVPQIVINGKLIGGYDDLVEYFNETTGPEDSF